MDITSMFQIEVQTELTEVIHLQIVVQEIKEMIILGEMATEGTTPTQTDNETMKQRTVLPVIIILTETPKVQGATTKTEVTREQEVPA